MQFNIVEIGDPEASHLDLILALPFTSSIWSWASSLISFCPIFFVFKTEIKSDSS